MGCGEEIQFTFGTFGFPPDCSSGSRGAATDKELMSSLSRLGLSPRLSGRTKKIHSTLSTLGMPARFSAPATKFIDLGVQSTLKTFELPPQLPVSTADIHSLLSTLGLSPRSSVPTTRPTAFNPSLPSQPRRQVPLQILVSLVMATCTLSSFQMTLKPVCNTCG